MGELKIRWRIRTCASPPPGMKQRWIEWQIVHGRFVVARCDSEEQAIRKREELLKGK